MSITAVVDLFILVVIFAVTERFIQLSLKAIAHELSNRFPEQALDVLHTADVACL